MNKPNLLLLGIDSASLDLVQRWRKSLPNLYGLMKKGTYGYLKSTIPPFSPPAWTALVTGKNPGKTGVFDWIKVKREREKIAKPEIVYLRDVQAPKLWDFLTQAGLKSCIYNVPLTYPPMELNGCMVSGIPGHMGGEKVTFPPSLKEELDSVVGNYEVYPFVDLKDTGRDKEYITEFERILKKRVKVALHLLEKENWDLFMMVFFLIDSIQHYFWRYVDKQHPSFDPNFLKRFGNVVKQFYIKVDKGIGKLIDATGNHTNIILVSDHGMKSLYGQFMVNNLFKRKGLLNLKTTSGSDGSGRRKILKKATWLGRLAPDFLRRFANRILPFAWKEKLTFRGRVRKSSEDLLGEIDWGTTEACAIGDSAGVFLQKDSNPEYVKNILKEGISYRKNGSIEIYEGKTLYEGPYINRLPDILCLTNRYRPSADLTPTGNLFSPSELKGHHAVNGLFIAAGPDVNPSSTPHHYSIYDVLPTVLRMLKVDVPPNLDGNVLNAVLKNDER